MQTLITGVETEIVRCARLARERFELGRRTGAAMVASAEITDAFLLDLPAAPPYTSASAADWDWFLTHH